MTWRREDYGYAAAALAAVLFVAYLIAGNFGLVPSPLGRGRAEGLPQADIAALAASERTPRSLPLVDVAPAAPVIVPVKHVAARPAAPTIHIDTVSGTTVKVTQKSTVAGHVTAPAGLRLVAVRFTPNTGPASTAAVKPGCGTAARPCAWSVPVPAALGSYRVTAAVEDALGRTALSNTINVTVIDTGGVVGGVVHGLQTTVSNVPTLISRVPSTLTGTLNNLLNALHL